LKYIGLIKSMSNNTHVKYEHWSCSASVTRRQNCSSACITNRLDEGCQGNRCRSMDFETRNNSNTFWPPANDRTQYMAMYYSHSQSPNPPVCHVEELNGERERDGGTKRQTFFRSRFYQFPKCRDRRRLLDTDRLVNCIHYHSDRSIG